MVKPSSSTAGERRLRKWLLSQNKSHSSLRVILAPGYDPTEEASEDEWPRRMPMNDVHDPNPFPPAAAPIITTTLMPPMREPDDPFVAAVYDRRSACMVPAPVAAVYDRRTFSSPCSVSEATLKRPARRGEVWRSRARRNNFQAMIPPVFAGRSNLTTRPEPIIIRV